MFKRKGGRGVKGLLNNVQKRLHFSLGMASLIDVGMAFCSCLYVFFNMFLHVFGPVHAGNDGICFVGTFIFVFWTCLYL